ncbi:MAG: hypothetical protein RJA44_509 [Pseudomonadota bacterium]
MSFEHPPLPWYDTPTVYGRVSRLLHWGGALVVLGMLASGLVADKLPEGRLQYLLGRSHVLLGSLMLLPLLLRVLWRGWNSLRDQTPQPISSPGWQRLVERGTHLLLLGLLLAVLLAGPLSIWAEGEPIRLIGSFELGSPIGEHPGLRRLCHRVHETGAKLLIPLLLMHLAGVLRHGRRAWERMAGQGRD